jgi:hypothetical protein
MLFPAELGFPWKPTIDAMGPILGQTDPEKPYNPNDDRIVRLHLHVSYDEGMKHNVDVAMWWRRAEDECSRV